ncbi:Basic helix-loop-helix DNA-binding superfamily protein, putative isoform 8 [Hibiscus syriacus]|uniref:Basic helix-loop-helix DNA-binding superfamily protein, putative isoform 8 n=1 Tax=Hibiscus syriacus TaxID=106335 RepID=A0A6A2X346_HIBSY|nr:Basic helix-loop-helix DNA-binding superfamily protein, putative isoform 8 [Hibiscus syriacus]
MTTTVLKHLLKSFCTNSPWTYAALWKLRHLSPMGLTWEDEDYVYPISTEILPSKFEMSIDDCYFSGYQIGLLVPNMLNLKYAWGEGVVGIVACTGKHCWVSFDDIFAGEANSNSFTQSIVLVPVLPHGVLQLGSLEMVNEDLSILAYIKDRFAYIHEHYPPLLMSRFSEKLEESSSASVNPLNSEDSNAVDRVKLGKLFSIQNAFKVSGMDLPEILESESKNNSVPPVSLSEVSSPLSQSISSSQLATQETILYGLSRLKDESQVFPLAPPFGYYYAEDAGFLSFDDDCELHKALGPAFPRESSEYLWESSLLSEKVLGDLFDVNESPLSLKQLTSRPQSVKDDPTPSSRLTSTAYVGVVDSSPKMTASSESTISMLTDNEEPEKGCDYTRSRKGQKHSSVAKRKARAGDKPRTRPRDRQLIHDRLKELRELVPNGAKYSIDALLDQTANHMLYLRSVTNRAEKLRQWVHREVTARKNARSSEMKNGYQNRTSCGFEIRDELKVCPIVVEYLAHQGHLLIEMLCDEHGLFLEIAQVIRSFNLTITKGVMERCSNDTWAHFIVEGSKDFNRLHIFWPLMQLLQRQRNGILHKAL